MSFPKNNEAFDKTFLFLKQFEDVDMGLDTEKYLPYLDQFDWSREEKIKILRKLWQAMEAQVDTAFGVSAVQLSDIQNKNSDSQTLSNALDSKGSKDNISKTKGGHYAEQ